MPVIGPLQFATTHAAPSVKPDSFPNIPQALFLVLALVLLEMLVGAALADLRQPLDLTKAELWALTVLLGNGLVFATVLSWKGMSYRELFNPAGSPWVPALVLLGLPVMATVPLILLLSATVDTWLVQLFPLSAWEQKLFEEMADPSLAMVILVCLLAPVLEEMLFRGVILRSFLTQYERPIAIGASALLFGAAHLNLYQFCGAFGLGMFAGWLYERSRSLLPCIVLHATYNAAVTLLNLGHEAGTAEQLVTFELEVWMLAVVLACAGAYALRRVLRGKTDQKNPRST